MIPSSWESALHSWLSFADGGVVIYSRQPEAPRPVRPFLTMEVIALRKVGQADRILTDQPDPLGDYIGRVLEVYEGTVSVQAFTDTPAERIQDLITSLESSTVQEKIDELSLTIREPASIVNLTEVAGTIQEQRAGADFNFTFKLERNFNTQAVEVVTSSSSVLM